VATYEKRLGTKGTVTWRVRVRKQGGPWLTKSFPKKSDAETWARTIEHRIDAGEHVASSESRKCTLGDAIDRYLEVVFPRAKRRKNAREQIRILNWWKEELGARSLQSITSAVVAEVRDKIASRKSRYDTPLKISTTTYR
jgi:hypothetical protein